MEDEACFVHIRSGLVQTKQWQETYIAKAVRSVAVYLHLWTL